ncbi:MAG: FtsX-like permease family protein [Deltaproteobacteria bacterium]|nr:FtsX-like permease family protein [Deltaproteobacteria bacterium]
MMEPMQGKTIFRVAHILLRAVSGFRRRPWLHAVSLFTLAAAFLSFAATLTVALNLNHLIGGWVGNSEMTVYLKDDTSDAEITQLKNAVRAIDGVQKVQVTTKARAREKFAKDLGAYGDIGSTLPKSAFPASLDIYLSDQLSRDRDSRHQLAARLSKVNMIDEVELYDDWFERLSAMSTMGRTAAWGLGLLAAVVAILVVAATVRTGVSARRKEISVMRFVGATQAYVRLPFLIEGAVEATLAMLLALLSLHYLMNHVDSVLGSIMPLLGGGSIIRLQSTILFSLIVGGFLAGLLGARLSLRKLEEA